MKINGLREFDSLGLGLNEYMINGSAAMVANGIIDENHDIDATIANTAFYRVSKFFKIDRETGRYVLKSNPEILDVEVDSHTALINFKKYFKKTVIINNHRFLSPEGLLMMYTEVYNLRKKDKYLDRIRLIEDFIKNH